MGECDLFYQDSFLLLMQHVADAAIYNFGQSGYSYRVFFSYENHRREMLISRVVHNRLEYECNSYVSSESHLKQYSLNLFYRYTWTAEKGPIVAIFKTSLKSFFIRLCHYYTL